MKNHAYTSGLSACMVVSCTEKWNMLGGEMKKKIGFELKFEMPFRNLNWIYETESEGSSLE